MDDAKALKNFLQWLQAKGLEICEAKPDFAGVLTYYPVRTGLTPRNILQEYLDEAQDRE